MSIATDFFSGVLDVASSPLGTALINRFIGPSGGGGGGLFPTALPGGAMPIGFELDLPGIDIAPQGANRQLSMLSAPFTTGTAAPSARTFLLPNPVTGNPTWFKPAGRPILFSGDLTAAKRVRKVAMRARRSRGGR